MNTVSKTFKTLALTSTILSAMTVASSAAIASSTTLEESTSKLLTANFESRTVVKIEAGDFHFVPGQVAPIHTHAAPAVGYVAKGEILYQVEGEKPRLLNDYIFPAEGAHPYKRDLDNVEFHLLDTGHFALEEDGKVIADYIRNFLSTQGS